MKVAIAIGAALLLSPILAVAQAAPVDLAQGLTSRDPAEIGRSIDAIGRRGGAASVRALGDRIADGLPPETLDSAVDALVRVGKPAARVLLRLASHRRASVRAKVVLGLAEMKAPGVRSVITGMLDDPNETVRAAAAKALGLLGASTALEELVIAARLGLEEAAVVLGDQVSAARVPQLLRAVDAESLDALAPALLRVVARDNVPVTAKRRILARLQELASPGALRLLNQIFERIPQEGPIRAETARLLNEMNRASSGEAQ